MTVHKNLGFSLKTKGFPRREIRTRVQEAAAAMAVASPPLIMVLFIQKYIVKGLTAGAVKG